MADDVRAALEKRLSAMSGVPAVAWENIDYTPTKGTTFIRFTLVTTVNRAASVGTDAQTYTQGLLFLGLFLPKGAGAQAADTLKNAVLLQFKHGTVLTEGSTRVLCDKAEPSLPMEEPDWYHVPISISWHTYN